MLGDDVLFLTATELDAVPDFAGHLRWFMKNKPQYAKVISGDEGSRSPEGRDGAHLLAIVRLERLGRILQRMFDEQLFPRRPEPPDVPVRDCARPRRPAAAAAPRAQITHTPFRRAVNAPSETGTAAPHRRRPKAEDCR